MVALCVVTASTALGIGYIHREQTEERKKAIKEAVAAAKEAAKEAADEVPRAEVPWKCKTNGPSCFCQIQQARHLQYL